MRHGQHATGVPFPWVSGARAACRDSCGRDLARSDKTFEADLAARASLVGDSAEAALQGVRRRLASALQSLALNSVHFLARKGSIELSSSGSVWELQAVLGDRTAR